MKEADTDYGVEADDWLWPPLKGTTQKSRAFPLLITSFPLKDSGILWYSYALESETDKHRLLMQVTLSHSPAKQAWPRHQERKVVSLCFTRVYAVVILESTNEY